MSPWKIVAAIILSLVSQQLYLLAIAMSVGVGRFAYFRHGEHEYQLSIANDLEAASLANMFKVSCSYSNS